MTTGFFDRLEARARATQSLLCVGLDPHPADLPEQTGAAAFAFCKRLIDATADLAVAYKPNAAFFEALGPDGITALRQVIAYVPDGIGVVLDIKRGDISSTAAAYARAAHDVLGADCVTLAPWMGRDAVHPFVSDPTRAAFVLCRTSNPSGADLQDRTVLDRDGSTRRAWSLVAELAPTWSEHGNVGLVVGATRPHELAAVRKRAPGVWILAPGVGAQGASLAEAMAAGLREDGLGLLVPVSRGISRAEDPRAAAQQLVDDMREAMAHGPASDDTALSLRAMVARGLLDAGCVKLGTFTLKSGLVSPIYLDLRRLVGFPSLLADVARLMADLARTVPHDVLAPLPYAGLPIGTAVSLRSGKPMVYPRREVKDYGTKAAVEGVIQAGQRALVLDDLATTGTSALEALPRLRGEGLTVSDLLVLIDRESGGPANLQAEGVALHAVFTLTELLDLWVSIGALDHAQAKTVRDFIAKTGA